MFTKQKIRTHAYMFHKSPKRQPISSQIRKRNIPFLLHDIQEHHGFGRRGPCQGTMSSVVGRSTKIILKFDRFKRFTEGDYDGGEKTDQLRKVFIVSAGSRSHAFGGEGF